MLAVTTWILAATGALVDAQTIPTPTAYSYSYTTETPTMAPTTETMAPTRKETYAPSRMTEAPSSGSVFNETRGFQQTDFFFGDGTGTAHDFEDGRAVRLCSSMAPSADWDASAWTVTSNAPGMSSDDFTPGRWCGYVAQGLT